MTQGFALPKLLCFRGLRGAIRRDPDLCFRLGTYIYIREMSSCCATGDAEWSQIRDALVAELEYPAAGIISAIMMAGDLLDGAFPRDGVGGSRFADELVILDQ